MRRTRWTLRLPPPSLRWSLLSLMIFVAPLAMLNPSLADPLKQLETGFCSGCALSGADLRGGAYAAST